MSAKLKSITPEQLNQLNQETSKRVGVIRELCTKETLSADWRLLITDEASRNYFLRMLTSVACAADIGIQNVPENEAPPLEFVATYHGAKEIVRFVISSAIADEIENGTFKLQ